MNADWLSTLPQALAESLVHFWWQGFVVAGVAAGLLHVIGPRRAQTRYVAYSATMLILAACPIITLAMLLETSPSVPALGEPDALVASPYAERVEPDGASAAQGSASWRDLARVTAAWIARHRATITWAWLAGVTVLSARLLLGAIGSVRMASAAHEAPQEWLELADRLARCMGFRDMPAIRLSHQLSQAVAVGIFRPLVLLPAAWCSGVSGEVLEAALAHELAHLRRFDLAVNALQRLVETLLFFHPTVWWCSRQMRIEREMCCDELALSAVGDRATYARSLSYLAQQQSPICEPLWGAGMGGPQMVLLRRIQNVLGVDGSPRGRLYGPVCAVVGAALASIVWAAVLGYRTPTPLADLPGDEQLERATTDFPIPPEVMTERTMFGQGVNSNAGVVGTVVSAPSEHAKRVLPNYTIEPPDILLIDVIRLAPGKSCQIQSGDSLDFHMSPEPPEFQVARYGNRVDATGRIDLGPRLPKVEVGGLTVDEAIEAVRKAVRDWIPDVEISLSLKKTLQPIVGEHLVSPDGTVNLGSYGQVYVAGMTLPEAKAAIEKHLSGFLDQPQASVSVFAYNSKVYYVIVEGGARGDNVTRLPITGNETVLDAISQTSGLSSLTNKLIWIARPAPGGTGSDSILPVNWQQITKGAATATNYQVLPGDRIFVVDKVANKGARY